MYVDRVHALCEVISHEGPTSSPVSLSREPGNEVDEGLLSQVFFWHGTHFFRCLCFSYHACCLEVLCKVQMHIKPLALST